MSNLSTDLHTTRFKVTDGMVSSVVTKFHLKSLAAQSLAKQLMTHADSKNWNLSNNFLHCLHCIRNCSWIPWAIAEKNSVRVDLQNF